MRPPLHSKFFEKAQAAITSAVEIYNKPSFAYREETFALLALNAWELLLKAKVLKDGDNDLRVIRVFEPRKTKAGPMSKKLYLKRNRAGNPQTISLGACVQLLEKSAARLAQEVKGNLGALTAVRDNSAHYISASPVLAKQVLEIAFASVKNFVILAKQWFDRDFSDSLSLVLPLSFVSGAKEVESVVVTTDESRLIKYLQQLAAIDSKTSSPFAVAVRLQVKLEKSSLGTSSKVEISKDPDAVRITLSEEDIREKYPWDYKELTKRFLDRYSDFKQDVRFHSVRKPLLLDEKYVKSRYLDPGNPKSPKKDFYNSNVIQVFDKLYKKR
jgi:hypothetical protein